MDHIKTIDDLMWFRQNQPERIAEFMPSISVLPDLSEYLQWLSDSETTTRLYGVELRRHRGRAKGIHPSSACKTNVCPLKLYYECTHEIEPLRRYDQQSQLTFDIGTCLHSMLQTHLAAMYDDQFKMEVPVRIPELHIKGSADGVLEFDNVGFVLEIKSIKEGGNFGWEKVTSAPMEDNVRQSTFYMHGTNKPFGLILYFCKNTSELREHAIQYDPDIWDGIVRDIKPAVDGAYNGGPKPEGKPGFMCRYCDFEYQCPAARRNQPNVRTDGRKWRR